MEKEYLIVTKDENGMESFLCNEGEAACFLAITESKCTIHKIGYESTKRLFIRRLNKDEGGYVEDGYGNLIFNFRKGN